jgi:hypothetical protein
MFLHLGFKMRLFLLPWLIVAAAGQNTTLTNIVVNALERTVAVPIYYLVAVGCVVFVLLLIIGCYCYCRRRTPRVAAPVAMQPQIVIGRKPRRAA